MNNDWISIDERLPELLLDNKGRMSQEVLIYTKISGVSTGYYTIDGWCWGMGELMHIEDMAGLTHWMPLPEPPKSEQP